MGALPEYHKRAYWENRYSSGQGSEWYGGWSTFAPILEPMLKGDVVVVGCGDSDISYGASTIPSVSRVVSLDYSEAVISQMANMYPALEWICVDMIDFSTLTSRVPLQQFDVVLDKGFIDAIVIDSSDIHCAITNMYSLLCDGGSLIVLSHSGDRGELLKRENVEIVVRRLSQCYVYTATLVCL